MIPQLSVEETKTAARMMDILSKKLYERGLNMHLGKMGAILGENAPNRPQIILNTKAVKEARNILLQGSKTKQVLGERQLKVIATFLEKDPETEEPLGQQTLLGNLTDHELSPLPARVDWRAICQQAAQETGIHFDESEEEIICGQALHQKIHEETFKKEWLDKRIGAALEDGEPWEAATIREEQAKTLAGILLKCRRELGANTAAALTARPEGVLNLAGRALWRDFENIIWNVARVGAPLGLQIDHLNQNLLNLDTLVPKLKTQAESKAFEKRAHEIHQETFTGKEDDPVPLSPIAWTILIMEMLGEKIPSNMPSPLQKQWLPEKSELKEETLIITKGEIIGSKEKCAATATGVWRRQHLLNLINEETDYPPIFEEKRLTLHQFAAHDHLPVEDRMRIHQETIEKATEGDPVKKLQILQNLQEIRKDQENFPWEEISVLGGDPQDEHQERLMYFLRVAMSAETLQNIATRQAGEGASITDIARKELEVRQEIAKIWSHEWDYEFQREYKTPQGFPESPKMWWDTWKSDILLMNLEMAYGKEGFKMFKKGGLPKQIRSAATTGIMLQELSLHENPFYWLRKDFFRAAIETDLPPNLRCTDFKWPVPYGTFFLEEGCLEVDGNPIGSITFAKIDQNEKTERLTGLPFVPIPKPKEALHNLLISANAIGAKTSFVLGSTTSLESTIEEAKKVPAHIELERGMIKECLQSLSPLDWTEEGIQPLEFTSAQLCAELASIVAKINLALSSRPALIQREHDPAPRDSKEPKEEEEPWLPNIIGENYRMKVETGETEADPAQKEGRSPRTHFRRGHFRNQACGKNLADRKIIWIEPIIVGIRGRLPLPKSPPGT